MSDQDVVTIQIVEDPNGQHQVLPITEVASTMSPVKPKVAKTQSAVWFYWSIKKKGASRDLDVVSCNKCQTEYVRRAYRCVKHTARCYDIPASDLTQPAYPINAETGEPVTLNADGTIDGQEGAYQVLDGLYEYLEKDLQPLDGKNGRKRMVDGLKSKLNNKLKSKEQQIREMRLEKTKLQKQLNDQAIKLQAKDQEFAEIKAVYDQLRTDYAKLSGQVQMAEQWKSVVVGVAQVAEGIKKN